MHAKDIDIFNFIKSKYWENNMPDVQIFFRRKTIEGNWIWLSATLVSSLDIPIPASIVHEEVVMDTERAAYINKVTSLTTKLVTTVGASILWKEKKDNGKDLNAQIQSEKDNEKYTLENDIAVFQSLLSSESRNINSNDVVRMEQLLQQSMTGKDDLNNNILTSSLKEATTSSDVDGSQSDSLPGVSLDLCKMNLDLMDVKLITLILTGHLCIQDLAPMMIDALKKGKSIAETLKGHQTEAEWRKASSMNNFVSKNVRLHHTTGRNDLQRSNSHKHTKRGYLSHNSSVKTTNQSAPIANTPNQKKTPKPPRYALTTPPPICALNMSFVKIGSQGLEMFCEVFGSGSPLLRIVDLSFCGIDEKGLLALARVVRKRKKDRMPDLHGLVLSGNKISYKAAKELGSALSSTPDRNRTFRKRPKIRTGIKSGYDEDDEDEDDDSVYDDGEDFFSDFPSKDCKIDKLDNTRSSSQQTPQKSDEDGLSYLRLACTSLTPDSLHGMLIGLGQDCPIQELTISSNNIGTIGAKTLVSFLEGKSIGKCKKKQAIMPRLNKIDLSNNSIGDDGAAKLTRIISKRVSEKANFRDLKLSFNCITAPGVETIMNKLLQHNLISLSLDNNMISDRGCQLVAASLPSMHHISRLNLSFNQIGSRGINALMRAIVGCESMTSLSLSGNVLKVSGAIAMGFALVQHPRLAELELENCCLSQVSQCHIVAGIVSNRWVPMKDLVGFRVGPPLEAIGGLDALAHHLSNEECFRIRRNIQMKNILQWMDQAHATQAQQEESKVKEFLPSANTSSLDGVNGVPSQSAYLRMLDWLSRIPFDEDELNDLRKYFFDIDGGDSGDGMRGSDGHINLKHRGDLLAALGSELVTEIRDSDPIVDSCSKENLEIGLDLDSVNSNITEFKSHVWEEVKQLNESLSSRKSDIDSDENCFVSSKKKRRKSKSIVSLGYCVDGEKSAQASESLQKEKSEKFNDPTINGSFVQSISSISQKSMGSNAESVISTESKRNKKARIAMFPPFAYKLELLKSQAQQLMDMEQDSYQQDIIAQQFAEASLTLLRQLRYHCMNNGLDGWRQGKLRRKVLIVDDSIVTRKLVSRAFEKANFIVDTAANGEEGVEKLKLGIYDIAFMDIDMPVMNGFDATKALRDWEDIKRPGARQPICALTAAYVDDFERSELMKFKNAGLDVMESKPCNIPRLFKVVDDVSPMFSDLSINVTSVPSI